MFTGLIQERGTVVSVRKKTNGLRLTIHFKQRGRHLKQGESIAVDGVCLTAAKISAHGFEADVVPETLKTTTLGRFQEGRPVHLERALKLGARLGGHFVSGHVEGRATVLRSSMEGNGRILWLKVPLALRRACRLKGSVTVNGVSLTVQGLSAAGIKVALVPHTLKITQLGSLQPGDQINLETERLSAAAPRETAKTLKRRIALLQRQGF